MSIIAIPLRYIVIGYLNVMRKSHILKLLRVICSIVVLLLLLALFLFYPYCTHLTGYLQATPGLLRTLTVPQLTGAIFLGIIVIITLLGGRIYCSFLCPIGTLQDIAIRLRKLFPNAANSNHYTKHHRRLRYTILAITIVILLGGEALPVGMLDPFANFGRLVTAILKPLQVWLNNYLFDHGWLVSQPHEAPPFALYMLLVAGSVTGLIVGAAIFYNRLFCNTLCPVGTLLGLMGKISWLKINFQVDACRKCGRCQTSCKANCIDSDNMRIDNERCVRCFNCLTACRLNGISYVPGKYPAVSEPDLSKRDFLFISGGAVAGAALLQMAGGVRHNAGNSVMPPGAINFDRFTATCISCQLCVSNCPGRVIKPAGLEYGLGGFLQPRLDFKAGYCEYDCLLCSELCPTGALTPLTLPIKQSLQLGIAQYRRSLCVVTTESTYCGACAEQCPTGAVHMVDWLGGLTIPKVEKSLCIGCGACENVCPVRPRKAIVVNGAKYQRRIKSVHINSATSFDKPAHRQQLSTDKPAIVPPDKQKKRRQSAGSESRAATASDSFPF